VDITAAVGRVFSDRYQIEEFLGGGGMAKVWRGRDLRLDRPVAIKELAGPWLRDPTALERFNREARTAARLAHPNIVAVYDVGVDSESRYLVMELIEGSTVSAMLADGPLPVVQAIAIAVQICDGLAAADAAGVIHRDIKPANLMLTPAGVVKICDFGIAQALMGAAETTLTGSTFAMGSTKYMAPEQVYGGHVDARADLYALGCTMYAMLVGAAPFSGAALEVLQQHVTQPPLPLREQRAGIPPALEDLVAQLLAKSPADRPADAAEVKTRLLALEQDPAAAVAVMPAGALGAVPKSAVRASALVDATDPTIEYGPASVRIGRNWRLAAAVVATALLAVLVSLMATSRSGPGGVAETDATSAAAVDSSVIPSATTSPRSQPVTQTPTVIQPSRSIPPTSQAPPVDPIVAMRLSIQQQVNTGNLNPDKDTDLYKKVDEVARAMNEGDGDEAGKKVQELRDKLASLLREGQLSAGGYDILSRDLDRIAAAQRLITASNVPAR